MKSSSHDRKATVYYSPSNQKNMDEYTALTGSTESKTINDALRMFFASRNNKINPAPTITMTR